MVVGSLLDGIPVVSEYKYLGLIMDNRLSREKHLRKLFGGHDEDGKKVARKIDFIKFNLSPFIRNISLEYRVNLWQTLTPLAMLGNSLCESARLKIERKMKKSLKMFMGLVKTVPDEILFSLVKVDFNEWAQNEEDKARAKWEARLWRQDVGSVPKYAVKCTVKYLPKEVSEFINLQCAFCEECHCIMRSEHCEAHGVLVPSVLDLLEELRKRAGIEVSKSGGTNCRADIVESLASVVREMNDRMKAFLHSKRNKP